MKRHTKGNEEDNWVLWEEQYYLVSESQRFPGEENYLVIL